MFNKCHIIQNCINNFSLSLIIMLRKVYELSHDAFKTQGKTPTDTKFTRMTETYRYRYTQKNILSTENKNITTKSRQATLILLKSIQANQFDYTIF